MTHLERFTAMLERGSFDRVPCAYNATKELNAELVKYMGLSLNEIVFSLFEVDRMYGSPIYKGPNHAIFMDGSFETDWGVRLRTVSYGHGTYNEAVFSPLEECDTPEEVAAYAKWPSPDDYDYTSMNDAMDKHLNYSFTLGYLSMGKLAWQLRGMETHLNDMLIAPEMADAVLGRISEWGIGYFERLLSCNAKYIGKNFTTIHLADDFGTQNGLLISPALYRRFYMPTYRRICEMAHAVGVRVEFHSCGSVFDLIPYLIETGIDMLNPVQTSAAKMNPYELKRCFGKEIAFSGGIDVQKVLPLCDTAGVRDEVFRLLDAMASDGGYCLEPGHAIQIGVPPQNVVAMYRALYEYYGLPCAF